MTRSVVIVVMLCLLGACSAVRLGYNTADKVLAYKMDDWFDLPEDQYAPARERLREVMAWHRHEELPRYARILLAAEHRLAQARPLQVAELTALQQQVTERLLVLGDQAADRFAPSFIRMGPAQKRRLQKRLDESNEEFRDHFITPRPAKVRSNRIDKLADRYEFWLGRLDAAQRERLARWVDSEDVEPQWRLSLREQRQHAFMDILDQAMREQSAPQTAARLKAFMADLADPADPQVRQRDQDGKLAMAGLTADLFNMASSEQRAKAMGRLRKMADDFQKLSGERQE